jgi:hypothetical protein
MIFFRRKSILVLGGILSFASLNRWNWSSTLTFSFSSAMTENVLSISGEVLRAKSSTSPEVAQLALNNPKQFVAIVACIRSIESWKSVNDTSLYNTLLPSIWPSITDDERKSYRIEVVLAFDQGDTFWESPAHRTDISSGLPFAVSVISVANGRPNHIPFNELCRSAYETVLTT